MDRFSPRAPNQGRERPAPAAAVDAASPPRASGFRETRPSSSPATADAEANDPVTRRGVRPALPRDELFECVFRQAAIGMALVSPEGRFLEVNDALCRTVGYGADELLARDLESLSHPSDFGPGAVELAQAVPGERAPGREHRYIHKDGSLVWVLLTLSAVRNDDDSRFLIAQLEDITRRKRAEAEVEAFFEASPDLLAVASAAGKLDVVNGEWERQLGWTREEMTSRPFLEFVHPDDRATTIAEAQATHLGEPSGSFRNRYRAKSGEYHWLEWNSRKASDGRLYCAVRDVTQREEEEQARRWLASLVESSEDAVIGLDTRGLIVSWNPGAALLFGYSADEMRGGSLGRLIPLEKYDESHDLQKRVRDGAAVVGLDTVRQRKDGTLVDVHIVASRVDDDLGQPIGWSVTARDITQRKRLSDALAAQVEELRGTKLLLDATFENMREGVVLLDATRRIVFANNAYAELFGFDGKAMAGVTREEFVGRVAALAEDGEAFSRCLMSGPDGAAASPAEFLFRLPRRILRRSEKLVGVGTETLYLVVWTDVTAEKDLMAEREREALTDSLTGISSRRAAEAALAQEIARAERSGSRFSVALLDIDHFKKVNDRHGHAAGDTVLRLVAGVLAAEARKTDLVARWGGEEFIAILPSDVDGGGTFCERARKAVEALGDAAICAVTLSAGVTEWRAGEDTATLVGRADDLLYTAKRLGRNRVIAGPE